MKAIRRYGYLAESYIQDELGEVIEHEETARLSHEKDCAYVATGRRFDA